MEHISVKINDKFVSIKEDFSVDFEDVNPLFNDYESFAADIELPIENNRSILLDSDTIQSDSRLIQLDDSPVCIYLGGNIFREGVVQTQDGEVVSDSVMIQMRSTSKTLDELCSDLNCREVPVKDKIQIGEKVGNIRVEISFDEVVQIKFGNLGKDDKPTHSMNLGRFNYAYDFEPQALGFSTPSVIYMENGKAVISENFINTSLDYTGKPYCNARVCYRHYKKEEDGTSGQTLSTEGLHDPYFVLDADRQQSGICFYLLYFLDCLFYHLGFRYDNSYLTSVGDMNKLCFFTTHCKYDVERKNKIEEYDFPNLDKINQWITNRSTKGKLGFSYNTTKSANSVTAILKGFGGEKTFVVGDKEASGGYEVESITYKAVNVDCKVKGNELNMYANSQNFPNATVKSILDSLWAGWGIKFITDYDRRSVTPVFIRDVFRDCSEPISFDAELISVHRINEKVSGVRMRYSAESDRNEQSKNISEGKREYDTHYDYIDYSNVSTSKSYLDILQVRSVSDMTCYITPNTGNAYRIKVDKDAKTVGEMRPTAFEVGGYKGIEVGDCSDAMSDYVEELTIDFTPALMTDVNGKNERNINDEEVEFTSSDIGDGSGGVLKGSDLEEKQQTLAVFVEEDMWHENIEMKLQSPMGNNYMDASLDCILTTDECYDPSSTDDGNSPLQHHDWGAAINMMRGGGADMQIQKYDYNYDGCGNYKWRTTAGDYTMNPDCIDNWGNDYDYNGTSEGIGNDERFSLKIQAYKEVDGQILCNADEVDQDGNITRKVRSRGLKDTFMSEYIHWLMNRKLVELKFRCEPAQLVGIQWMKRYRIGEYVFFWNKLNYTATAKDGLGVVTAQVYI